MKKQWEVFLWLGVDSANLRANIWGSEYLTFRRVQHKFRAELLVTCLSWFSGTQRSLWTNGLWFSEAAFLLQNLCYAGGQSFWQWLGWGVQSVASWTAAASCCWSSGGRGSALVLCSLWGLLISFPLIANTKSAHSSLHEREGFCLK